MADVMHSIAIVHGPIVKIELETYPQDNNWLKFKIQ